MVGSTMYAQAIDSEPGQAYRVVIPAYFRVVVHNRRGIPKSNASRIACPLSSVGADILPRSDIHGSSTRHGTSAEPQSVADSAHRVDRPAGSTRRYLGAGTVARRILAAGYRQWSVSL